MSPFRYHDEEPTAASALYIALGALAGFAAGVVVAQHYGGVSGLSDRIREKLGRQQSGDNDTTLPDGVAFVLSKPVDVDAMLALVRHHCG